MSFDNLDMAPLLDDDCDSDDDIIPLVNAKQRRSIKRREQRNKRHEVKKNPTSATISYRPVEIKNPSDIGTFNVRPRASPASTNNSKAPPSGKQSSAIKKENYSNTIVTGYVPESQDEIQHSVDILIYDIPSKIIDEQFVLGFKYWGKLISVSKKMQRNYMTLRVKITLNENFAIAYYRAESSDIN